MPVRLIARVELKIAFCNIRRGDPVFRPTTLHARSDASLSLIVPISLCLKITTKNEIETNN